MEHMVSSDDNSSDLPSDISDSGDENEGKAKHNTVCTGQDGPLMMSFYYLYTVKNSIKLLIKKQPKPRQRRRTKKEPNPSGRDQATVASAPPKRSKMSKVPAKTRRVQPIERDESGNPKLPQQIGVLTVLKLGSIEPHREAFHNERYIFPVGYTVSR
jgi:phage/plasmid-associated DNA primase